VGRALATRNVSSTVLDEGSGGALGIAVPAPGGAVAYQESAIDPTRPVRSAPGSPYSELILALYASSRPDPHYLATG